MKKQIFVISHLKCSKCNNIVTVPRKRSKLREDGHTKHMYCPFCQEITPFEENKELNY